MTVLQDFSINSKQLIQWRRHLHMHPELSFHEKETSQFVYETLQSFPNLEVSRPTPYSVMARLIGKEAGKTIALRADMDALPITEENSFDFVSQTVGAMHACGHDAHTAILLEVARLLSQQQENIKGEIRFLFQHAEEVLPGGAQEMIKAGVMDDVDHVVGAHVWSPLPVGQIGIVYGPAMAAPDTFTIHLYGKGGHAAIPHDSIDPILMGTQIVAAFQGIISRNTDPIDSLVLSITQFHAGTTDNVTPETATLTGTVRSFHPSIREHTKKRMTDVLRGITSLHNATYSFDYADGYLPVINEDSTTSVIEKSATELFGKDSITYMKPQMVGEDFSAYQQKAKGSFFFIGGGNEDKGIIYPHHHPKFTIDEDCLEIGVKTFLQIIKNFM